jgi:hypothetical protein
MLLTWRLLQVGLQALTGLSTLRSLNLVSYGGRSHHCLDNRSFGCVGCCIAIPMP